MPPFTLGICSILYKILSKLNFEDFPKTNISPIFSMSPICLFKFILFSLFFFTTQEDSSKSSFPKLPSSKPMLISSVLISRITP